MKGQKDLSLRDADIKMIRPGVPKGKNVRSVVLKTFNVLRVDILMNNWGFWVP